MTTCRKEALKWVHRYAAGGAAVAALPLPVAHTTTLAALETYMLNVIGDVYDDGPSGVAAAAAGGTFAIGGQALRLAAIRAACFVPVLGIPIRMGIAWVTIEGLGRAIVAHYERKHPGKIWAKAS